MRRSRDGGRRLGALALAGGFALLPGAWALAPRLGLRPPPGPSAVATAAAPRAAAGAASSGAAGPAFTAVRDAALRPAREGFLATGTVFDPQRSPFRLRVGTAVVTHRVVAVTALPGEELDVVPAAAEAGGLKLRHEAGSVRRRTGGGWVWRAPARPGIHALRVESAQGDFVHVNVLVMHPRASIRGGVLDGFRIGSYQEKPLRGNPAYEPPRGFVQVPGDARDVLVSPHFTLGQFLCKQPGEPAYLALSPPLVRKLEALLLRVNEAGYSVPTLHVMSGFRTPWYNRSIGNTTVYSRHLWGDAADVFVDADGDGEMDDLNGDGVVDVQDGKVLARLAEGLAGDPSAGVQPGGLAVYRRNAVHGPFVHVDARGFRARW